MDGFTQLEEIFPSTSNEHLTSCCITIGIGLDVINYVIGRFERRELFIDQSETGAGCNL